MGQSQKVILNTIRMILDDDASTELSPLHRIDIHLVAHAMKWAIRYSEETLVTYDDYRVLYLDQGMFALFLTCFMSAFLVVNVRIDPLSDNANCPLQNNAHIF